MHQRTSNPNNKKYRFYGGRGISVCDEWKEFIPFYQWAINNGFSKELELDRRDSNGNYCPENCRWVDMLTNRRNVPSRKRNKPYNWGINESRNHKFNVQIWMNGKINHVGRFETEELAIEAREKFLKGEIGCKGTRPDKGIYELPSGKLLVHVVKNKKAYHVGIFKTKEEALLQRDNFIIPNVL